MEYAFLKNFSFDGKETSHLFQIAKVTIPFLSKQNELLQVGNSNGSTFLNTRRTTNTIQIDGFMIKDNSGMNIYDTKDELVRILNTNEPKQLFFDMFPNRYFNAIFSGTQEYDATDSKYTPLTLTFDVPDGLAHNINPSSYTNVYTTSKNLVLDSEYKHIGKYLKPWVYLVDDKYNGSNIVSADFTDGLPLNFERPDDWDTERWYNLSPMSMRRLPDLTKGTSIFYSISAKVKSIDNDDSGEYSGQVVLEEWDTKNSRLLYRHPLYISKEVTSDFTRISNIVTIQDERTNGLLLNYGFYGKNIIEFSQPMVSFSNTEETYVASTAGYSDIIEIENNGTAETYPQFTFTMNGENGLVGLLHEDGSILQFGNPENVDGKDTTKSLELGVNQSFWGNTLNPEIAVNSGFKSVWNPTPPNEVRGSWDMATNVNSVTPHYAGVGDIGVWHGPTMMMDIKPPYNNDRNNEVEARMAFMFDNDVKYRRGRYEFSVFDENGNPIMTTILSDANAVSNTIQFELWYKGSKLGEVSLNKSRFSGREYEIVMLRRGNKLQWNFIKVHTTNRAKYEGTTYAQVIADTVESFNWTLEEKDSTKWMRVGVWAQRYSNQPVAIQVIRHIQVRWLNTSYYQDIRNYFQDGDIVEIDVASRSLFVNGVINNELNVVGNQWESFILPVGKTVIQPVLSTWANNPDVVCAVRDSWN